MSFAEGVRERLPSGMLLATALAPDLPPALFDRVCLLEALDTIAVNALEAQGGTGAIELRSRLVRHGAAPRIAVSIADRGPGIEGARLPRVFDLFYTSKPTGTGVGLAVAKRLVERQGGTIEAASPTGGGAVFTIYLPVADGAA
jgi:signal transduction histidine kinase